MRRIIVVLVAFLLVGCVGQTRMVVDPSSAKTFSITKIVDTTKTISQKQLDEDNQLLLERKMEEVLNFCLPVLSGYEKKSAVQARQAYWLSMSGLVAGSIAVPALAATSAAANAGWIAGLGGWAGATNFAGQNLRESGLSGSTIAETRNSIIRRVTDQIEIAIDGTNSFEERRNALMKARAACVMYEIAVPTISEQK
ncbi:MAG: hypothetical protein Q8M92_05805 [Candidatus Subteraquimicrobiales bacterium]|nr:hypothetical protein [Candidatus Subteraquimicrobiales bacterium]